MRNFNFSAGPSMLPLEVLEKVRQGLTDYEGTGMSVMEMSHRSKPYQAINDEAEASLRELMNVPENYDIIFVQGGASMQFEAIPLNIHKSGKADYVVTGNFSGKAYKEAKKYGDMAEAASSADKNFWNVHGGYSKSKTKAANTNLHHPTKSRFIVISKLKYKIQTAVFMSRTI